MRMKSPQVLALAAIIGVFCSCARFNTTEATTENNASEKALRELRSWLALPREARGAISNMSFATVPLTRTAASAALQELWSNHATFIRATREAEMKAKVIQLGNLKMKFDWLSFTNTPVTNGRSLFISMHGGGGAPTAVNDSQWRNQVQLGKGYKPRKAFTSRPEHR